jgi:hypothetical protein
MPHPSINDQEMSMKTQLALSAIVTALAVLSQAAIAQTTAPASRADVKADAKTGAPRAGEAPFNTQPGPQASGPSTKTRAERKSETKTAAEAGTLKPAGEASHKADDKADKMKAGSTTTRAERKAATKAAPKTPAGEVTPAPKQ